MEKVGVKAKGLCGACMGPKEPGEERAGNAGGSTGQGRCGGKAEVGVLVRINQMRV